ncbi:MULTISPECIES: LysR substrate-binding domain-containing protein [Gordonia]|uniref:LysR substrate-binding domain-containing protein n=1 Tax=Gordonia aquimaris TaxID=2984863 RepID=A0A9X3I4W5_9ACTN|nr:LysR substrate-binding domain-containing protein [Gordonia aquimaris]MCX2964425.1 LysR substrate-binding domain-containing protein [Gordonia aquimaris]
MIDQSTVGHAQTFTTVDLPAVLADYHRPHPGVKIEFVEDISPLVLVMQNLLRGGLDMAFIALDDRPLDHPCEVLTSYHEPLVWASR